MVIEVKVVCRFCQHSFWASLAAGPGASGELFEVACPQHGIFFEFRVVRSRDSPWDESWVYQATEWRTVQQLSEIGPVARSVQG